MLPSSLHSTLFSDSLMIEAYTPSALFLGIPPVWYYRGLLEADSVTEPLLKPSIGDTILMRRKNPPSYVEGLGLVSLRVDYARRSCLPGYVLLYGVTQWKQPAILFMPACLMRFSVGQRVIQYLESWSRALRGCEEEGSPVLVVKLGESGGIKNLGEIRKEVVY